MIKRATSGLPYSLPILLMLVLAVLGAPITTGLQAAETTLIKNANLLLPSGTWQPDSFLIIEGCKIKETGRMIQLKQPQRKHIIYDNEVDAEGGFLYPAFIDPFVTDLQQKTRAKGNNNTKKDRRNTDKTKRPPIEKRNYFIQRNAADNLDLEESERNKRLAEGFAYAHIVPPDGIIGGTTCVASLSSTNPTNAVLTAENFMIYRFKVNSFAYPATLGGIAAEMIQLKEDCRYYQELKKKQFFHPYKRAPYRPDFQRLSPYFTGSKQFMFQTQNALEQRMLHRLARELKLKPVLVADSDVWRENTPANTPVILPLTFTPPLNSKYSRLGEEMEKKAKEKLYPEKIAAFIKNHKTISLAPPKNGDYKTLFKNIVILVKNGVPEMDIIDALTINPAKLLEISSFAGTLQKGKLGSFFIADKKITEEKAVIKKVFVEGHPLELKTGGDITPPQADISGNWTAEVESQQGAYTFKLSIKQNGNDLTGQMISPMFGTVSISDGIISGNSVTFTVVISIGAQKLPLSFALQVKDKEMEGIVEITGSGSGTVRMRPESSQMQQRGGMSGYSHQDFHGGDR